MIITGKKFSKPELSRVVNGDIVLDQNQPTIEKLRLDHLLMKRFSEHNRADLQRFVKQGYVTVDGVIAKKPNQKYAQTAEIVLELPQTEKILPKLPIIYEDENVLVVNKPSGLLSMTKGKYSAEPTLEDYGLLVHRLDRDTSGVVILAKNPATQKMLRKQFQERKTHKTYYAVVKGAPKLTAALIDLPIARNLKRPTTFMVDQNGKSSQTAYQVLKTGQGKSLLELKPTTGRTHQLRVHLKHLGVPIVGDPVYGDGRGERLMLHAGALEISIPGAHGNIRKTFTAPLPANFTEMVQDESK